MTANELREKLEKDMRFPDEFCRRVGLANDHKQPAVEALVGSATRTATDPTVGSAAPAPLRQ
jgi:hypothetical protein